MDITIRVGNAKPTLDRFGVYRFRVESESDCSEQSRSVLCENALDTTDEFHREFAQAVGLQDFFYDREFGLLRLKKQAIKLMPMTLHTVRNAHALWRLQHAAMPHKKDEYSVLFQWYERWVDWALNGQHCQFPCIHWC